MGDYIPATEYRNNLKPVQKVEVPKPPVKKKAQAKKKAQSKKA